MRYSEVFHRGQCRDSGAPRKNTSAITLATSVSYESPYSLPRFIMPSTRFIALVILSSLACVMAFQAQDPEEILPAAPKDYSVIFISVDGLRPDAVISQGIDDVPNFYRLRNEGAFTDNARTAIDYTITLPNHTGMVTSRLASGPEGHHWTINKDPPLGMTLHKNKGERLVSMFSVAHDHGLRTALFASKSKFSIFNLSYNERFGALDTTGEDNGRDKIDTYIMDSRSEKVVDQLEDFMETQVFDLLMLHIRNPDTAGHALSWTLKKPSLYMSSIKRADEMLGDIFEQIEENEGWKDRTFVVLTADHGGEIGTKGHSNNLHDGCYTIPFYVWGPGIPAGAELYDLNPESRANPGNKNPAADFEGLPPIRNADAGNLCLDLLGLPPIPGSTMNSTQDLKLPSENVTE